MNREHVPGWPAALFLKYTTRLLWTNISRGGELRYLSGDGFLLGTLAEHGGFSVIMTFPIFGLKSQTLSSCLRTSVVLAIFLFSETGFPSLMIACAGDVALRVAMTPVATSKPGVESFSSLGHP